MIPIHTAFFSIFLLLSAFDLFAQSKDTTISVGQHSLHFNIIAGKGIPIIFESGGGNDASVWQKLLAPLSARLGAPLITYDRAGFGKSGIDTANVNLSTEVADLKRALNKLGYNEQYFFVAHSFGGNYTLKFAHENKGQVLGAVMIDIVSPYFMTMERGKSLKIEYADRLQEIKKESLGFYHLTMNYENSTAILHEVAPHATIPMTIIGSGITAFEEPDRSKCVAALKKFADEKDNRKYVLEPNAQHHIFYDNPALVIEEIQSLYKKTTSTE
ncbi:alpha/beta hydrolase [Sphingobacterium ginsenosidimutans]|uniref:Alpha/beta hydrolase n=2 Tax=Sphingobacterium TaxID=28453 RepID=A0ABP7ZXK9_9SPHI